MLRRISENFPSETVRKGLGGVCDVAERADKTVGFGPITPLHSGQICGRSVARTFRTVSLRRWVNKGMRKDKKGKKEGRGAAQSDDGMEPIDSKSEKMPPDELADGE